jgi:hypothetical protein
VQIHPSSSFARDHAMKVAGIVQNVQAQHGGAQLDLRRVKVRVRE